MFIPCPRTRRKKIKAILKMGKIQNVLFLMVMRISEMS